MATLRRSLLAVPVAGVVLALAGCDVYNTVARGAEPVVLTGADLPSLVGTPPDELVAFRWVRHDETSSWEQVPVQVDERKVVPFGSDPTSNATPGTTGTVYGTASTGLAALQYADAGTFVGADVDPTLDADDEVVVLASDAGGRLTRNHLDNHPAGVLGATRVEVRLDDPLGDDHQGWVYLFRAEPGASLDPAAGRDDVDYDFVLASGAYTTTYRRAVGPNPETSTVRTAAYEAVMTDRWIETDWRILAGDATGVDILDGSKAQFSFSTCGRSNVTFAAAEGAFVANVDGPLRAIRSYVGANSGPLTQRTHVYYGDRQVVTTDLRVHTIPSVMDFVDLSSAAAGMTYRSSTHPGGVAVDGVPDAIGGVAAAWELWSGEQGSLFTTSRLETSADVGPLGQVYVDDTTPPQPECWGDGGYYGAAGQVVDPPGAAPIPNTDPRMATSATFRTTRVLRYAEPGVSAETAATWADWVDTPLVVTVDPPSAP